LWFPVGGDANLVQDGIRLPAAADLETERTQWTPPYRTGAEATELVFKHGDCKLPLVLLTYFSR